jgi:WhiB family redox-sensing transcriptional regulator
MSGYGYGVVGKSTLKCERTNAVDTLCRRELPESVVPEPRALSVDDSRCAAERGSPMARCDEGVGHMDWRHRAACLDEDPELFFPIGNTGPALLQIEEAKQVCRRCDVRDACLQWAIEAGQDHGVWGGMSEDERRALKRRAARARIRTA